jgi:hypothetical protein
VAAQRSLVPFMDATVFHRPCGPLMQKNKNFQKHMEPMPALDSHIYDRFEITLAAVT